MRREKELHALRLKYGILEIKPGITGFAQVNGRDIMSVFRKVALERHYKQNRSLRLKAFILAKTAVTVLRAAGVKF
jgi:O-antigen biosynthesis protein WbqP